MPSAPPMEPVAPVAPLTMPVAEASATASVPPPPQATQVLKRPPKELGMLVARNGPHAGRSFNLAEITNIGRDPQRNEISLGDEAMSRENTRIKLENGQFVIYDLASTNGTWVNGEKILRHVLANGDEIQIGETSFAFVEIKTKGRE
jgi:pSer/pThr/pTyr-binding forkhead associated (FHA) protein